MSQDDSLDTSLNYSIDKFYDTKDLNYSLFDTTVLSEQQDTPGKPSKTIKMETMAGEGSTGQSPNITDQTLPPTPPNIFNLPPNTGAPNVNNTNNNTALLNQHQNASISSPVLRQPHPVISEHKLSVAYGHAQAYMNLFKPSKVDTWFDESVSLFKNAQVPTHIYLFNIITCCNSFLPTSKHIEWTTSMDTVTAKAFIIKAFQVSHEEKVQKALTEEVWKNKNYRSQLNDLTAIFGNNYELKKEFLMKRFPTNQQTLAFTKIQALEANAGIAQEQKLKDLANYIDQYNISYPAKETHLEKVNMIGFKQASNGEEVVRNQMRQMEQQKEEMIQTITQGVINNIQKMKIETPAQDANNGSGPKNKYYSNRNDSYVDNIQDWRNKENNQSRKYNIGGYKSDNYRPRTHDQNYRSRDNNPRPRRQNNTCSEHFRYGGRATANGCRPGCRFHPARLCYGHARFGDQCWKDKCEPFCRRYGETKN